MAKVPNGVEKLLKISTAELGCTSVTDRRQTDGRQHIANVNEFKFAKNTQNTHSINAIKH